MPSLEITYLELRNAVTHMLGMGTTLSSYSDLSNNEKEIVDDLIRSGLRSFYSPKKPGSEAPYVWSFLIKEGFIQIIAGGHMISGSDLPDGYHGGLQYLTFPGKPPLSIVPLSQLRRFQQAETSGLINLGTPRYATSYHREISGGHDWVIELYPSPDQAMGTATFGYQIFPPALDNNDDVPFGAEAHSETILLSCFAAAEMRINDAQGVYWDRFQERLSAAIESDSLLLPSALSPWPLTQRTESELLALRYDDFVREVGRYMQFGLSPATFDHLQEKRADNIVQRGYRLFLSLRVFDGKLHSWSFMNVTRPLVLGSNQNVYDLPEDFEPGFTREFTVADASRSRVPVISETRFRSILGQDSSAKGEPRYCTIRAMDPEDNDLSEEAQRFEVLFYPAPDRAYDLEYSYRLRPSRLTTNSYPIGGSAHSETILRACLAVAEEEKTNQRGPMWEAFMESLQTSKALDDQAMEEASWPLEGSSTSIAQGWEDFIIQVGLVLGLGPDRHAWSHTQFSMADSVVQSGYRMFFYARQWRFRRIRKTLSLEGGTSTYELPFDFSGFVGRITFENENTRALFIDVIKESRMRELHQVYGAYTGRPEKAAVVHQNISSIPGNGTTLPDGSLGYQVKKVQLWPVPNSDYTLGYTYNIVPRKLTDSRPTPYGGEEHGETILAACLAEAELRKNGQRGGHWDQYQILLQQSAKLDGESDSPEYLGYTGSRNYGQGCSFRRRGNFTILINGESPD